MVVNVKLSVTFAMQDLSTEQMVRAEAELEWTIALHGDLERQSRRPSRPDPKVDRHPLTTTLKVAPSKNQNGSSHRRPFCPMMEETARRIDMFSSGNVTVYVSNMDNAVRFYTETLGLKLAYRFGDHWASVEIGKGLTIGLHPASAEMPAGRKGSMAIGLELNGSIHDAVRALEAKGVHFDGPVNEGKAGSFVGFLDPDGNQLYLAQMNWTHVNQGEGQYQHA